MTESSRTYTRGQHEGILSAISFGFFLILIGTMFIATPNLLTEVNAFLSHFKVVQVPATNMYVPTPQILGSNTQYQAVRDVFLAAREFSLIWGVFLIALLGARFLLDSPFRRKAQNVGDIVFWLGAVYLIETFLAAPIQASTLSDPDLATKWFEFWAAVIMLIGVSLIARAIYLVAARARND